VELSIENLVDLIWENKPNAAKGEIFIHEEWAGRTTAEKVGWVRKSIAEKGGKSAIFNDLSEVGWVLNLRSSDIPFNPFFKGVLVVKTAGGALYLPTDHPSLGSQTLKDYLGKVDLQLQPYEPVFEEDALINKSSLNYYIFSSIKDKNPIEWDSIGVYRAVRSQMEMDGFRRSHLVDGVAMAKFWAWRSKLDQIDDYEAALYMDKMRAQQEHNRGPSFETISGGGPNAAVIHYHPTETNHALITKDMIHLVDSGGQYLDGTTDVTRTFHFGKPTTAEKDSFTRVLLGVLDIERLKMPLGKIHGGDIDVLARRHLWAKGKDYCHGTGHGVGYFQGVHEGPVAISKYNTTNFKTGMIVTVEPGYYETGQYGIRIENMVLVQKEGEWNFFENLTLCPYDRNLIDQALLTKEDAQYIDDYHQRVWKELSPRLQDDPEATAWLKQATAPL
jgi:Xaa-Pro aminopeptidase